MMLAIPSSLALIQYRVSDKYRCRVVAPGEVAFRGSRPISAAVTGIVADRTSPTMSLLTVTVGDSLGAVITRPNRVTRPASTPKSSGDCRALARRTADSTHERTGQFPSPSSTWTQSPS